MTAVAMKRRRKLGFMLGAFSVITCLAALARELEIEARSNCPACPTVSLWADGKAVQLELCSITILCVRAIY